MFTKKILQCCTSMGNRRFISQSMKNFDSKSANSAAKTSTSARGAIPGRAMYSPNNFDKWILVWVKRFPKGQVPELISEEVIYQAKSKARVKFGIILMIGTLAMSMVTIFQAKGMVKRGDSIQRRQDEWRAKVIEEGKQEKNQ